MYQFTIPLSLKVDIIHTPYLVEGSRGCWEDDVDGHDNMGVVGVDKEKGEDWFDDGERKARWRKKPAISRI